MARVLSLILALACVFIASASAAPKPKPCVFQWKVHVKLNRTVPVGTTCSWVWADIQSHCVKPVGKQPDKKFGSGNFVPPYTYSFKFTKKGVYKYDCCIHQALMKGTLIVK